MVIQKVEAFKIEKGRLPNSEPEMNLKVEMDSPAFYEKRTDSTYVVWYGIGLGDSRVFYSDSKTWREEG